MMLTQQLAEKFTNIALGHVELEYPNKLDHVMGGDADAQTPKQLHPVFYGSFDWHSCVHGYWLLARTARKFPAFRPAKDIAALFARNITEAKVAVECAYLQRPESRGFERPYGWAWVLALQAELDLADSDFAKSAAQTLRPLTEAFASRFKQFLPLCDYPMRSGEHSNTAFALRLATDYAERSDRELFEMLEGRARRWYSGDENCQAWEPSQSDFLSPALMEAACMRRLSPGKFGEWFSSFLPRMKQKEPASVFSPARVSDRSDGKIAHLDGLNLSRAWCWREIADGLDEKSAAEKAVARAAAKAHIDASIGSIAGEYAGEHWLATYAMLALDGIGE